MNNLQPSDWVLSQVNLLKEWVAAHGIDITHEATHDRVNCLVEFVYSDNCYTVNIEHNPVNDSKEIVVVKIDISTSDTVEWTLAEDALFDTLNEQITLP